MRAVFTVDLPIMEQGHGGDSAARSNPGTSPYPENTDLLRVFRSCGWEPSDIADLVDEHKRRQEYVTSAEKHFEQMPEIAAEEKSHVLFYGLFAGDHTKFVVTRPVAGQITFRLLNPVLPRLQSSIIKMVRQLLNVSDKALHLSDWVNRRIDIYEVGNDHIIIGGRVITRPGREAIRANTKDAVLALASLFVTSVTLLYLYRTKMAGIQDLMKGTMERLSTAMLTTTIVSALGLLHTYWGIRRRRLIVWSVRQGGDEEEPLNDR